MRLPFLSRAAFDIALDAERRRADAEHENAQMLRRENADLLAKYHMLRLQGADSIAPTIPREAKDIDPITAAIRDRVPRGLRAEAIRQARHDRDAGKSEIEILHAIERGIQPDGIPA